MLDRPFRPETRVVRRNGAPSFREHSADICVVGAGISGVSAAIEAARLGRSVILIDGLPALGGQAVNSIIGMIVGLFGNPPRNKQLTHGIADDIIRDLGYTGDLHVVMGGVSLNALYDEVALGRWVERKVLELKITPLAGRRFAERAAGGPRNHGARTGDTLRRRDRARRWLRGCDRRRGRGLAGGPGVPRAGRRRDLRLADDGDREFRRGAQAERAPRCRSAFAIAATITG